MTLTNVEKRSFFAPTQHIKTIITLVLLEVESWLIALFKAIAKKKKHVVHIVTHHKTKKFVLAFRKL